MSQRDVTPLTGLCVDLTLHCSRLIFGHFRSAVLTGSWKQRAEYAVFWKWFFCAWWCTARALDKTIISKMEPTWEPLSHHYSYGGIPGFSAAGPHFGLPRSAHWSRLFHPLRVATLHRGHEESVTSSNGALSPLQLRLEYSDKKVLWALQYLK